MLGAGVLNRADDAIPTREELLASPERRRGLPRPLLAVLLGHTKMWAFEMLMETDFADGAVARPLLEGYFPGRLRESFGEHLAEHTLRREIVGTVAINHVVNNAGITFLSRQMADSKADIGAIVTAYLEVDAQAGAAALRDAIEAASLEAPATHEALLEMEAILADLTGKSLAGERVEAASALEAVKERLRKST
jgi:glutamate dehydrogenase